MQRYIISIIIPFLIAAILLSTTTPLWGHDVMEIVNHIDKLYRSNSSYAVVEMEVITPHWHRTLKMKIWSKGMKRTFIRILSPKKEEGVGTLRIGNEMWNFLPKTNKVIKIPPSMMMSSWMGSDFTNDDLVREYTFLEDYLFTLITPQDAEEDHLYVECRPKENVPIIWDRVVIAVRSSDYIPVWQKYYDEKRNVIRIMNLRDIKTFNDRQLPILIEMIPQNKEGHKTIIRYLEIEFDKDIPEEIFSLRNLRNDM